MKDRKKKKSHQHDRFFKRVFDQKPYIKALLNFSVDKAFLSFLDLESIEKASGEFISHYLGLQISDLVLKVSVKNEPYTIFFIFEHQSTWKKSISLRLLHYMLALAEGKNQKIKKNERIPLVIPLVLYMGKMRVKKKALLDLFMPDERIASSAFIQAYYQMMEKMMLGGAHLIDLNQIEEEALIDFEQIGPLLFLMQERFRDDLKKNIPRFFEAVKAGKMDSDLLESSIEYLLHLQHAKETTEIDKAWFQTLIDSLEEEEVGKKYTSIADILYNDGLQVGIEQGIKRGLERGLERGRQEERETLLQQLIAAGFDPKLIEKATGLALDCQAV
jgi:predicted transposase/invertase (TIGR01784 family)